ncbi:F-box domain-containing protein [Mycena kentingensis (nom. inval.)]|nr:F-box domain-containing protein [Mycena kentingensis (nom. inval.)]
MYAREEHRDALNVKIASVSAQIAALQAELGQLLAERNWSEPVGSLPPEILAEVFQQVPELPWDALMLVCRRWHDVCMSTPALWAHIDLPTWDSRRIKAAARYSGKRVSSIRVRKVVSNGFVAALLAQMAPELRALSLSFAENVVSLVFKLFNAKQFPRLLELYIRTHEEGAGQLVLGAFPAMHTLCLRHALVDFGENATLGRIRYLDLEKSFPLPVDVLLRCLSACSELLFLA